MKNTKNTKLVGFEPMSKAETAKVLGGKKAGAKKIVMATDSEAKRPKKK